MYRRGSIIEHPRNNYRRWTKSRLLLCLGACLLVFLLFLFVFYTYRVNQFQAEQEHYEEKKAHYLEKEAELKEEKEKLQSKEYIEDLARRNLGLIRPDEKVIILED